MRQTQEPISLDRPLCGLGESEYEPELVWVVTTYDFNGALNGTPIGCTRTVAESIQRANDTRTEIQSVHAMTIKALLQFALSDNRSGVTLYEKQGSEWVSVRSWRV